MATKVFFDTGKSLDGYIAGENRGPKNPSGDGGPTIHSWMYQQKAFWKYLGMEGGNEEGADSRGIRLFDNIDKTRLRVEIVEANNSPLVAHLHFKVTNR